MRELIVNVTDLETTGLDATEGHKIIEIAMALVKLRFTDDNKFEGFKKIGATWSQRVDPKRSIDAGAQNVHGIDIKELRGQPVWAEVAPRAHKILTASDVIVAHNLEFDAPFLAVELNSVSLELPPLAAFCTLEQGRGFTAMGKVPSLKELCWSVGVKYNEDEAHAADYDVDLTVEALVRGLQYGYFDMSDILNEMYEEKAA